MKKTIFILFSSFCFTALIAQPPAGNANVGDYYGNKVSENKPVKTKVIKAALSKDASSTIGDNVTMEGKVVEVCPKKGCWVKLQLSDKTIATVKMKDYAFFVPVNLEGKNVKIEGKAEVTSTSVAELKHFAEDAGKSQEEISAITVPKKEVKILASGIKVIK